MTTLDSSLFGKVYRFGNTIKINKKHLFNLEIGLFFMLIVYSVYTIKLLRSFTFNLVLNDEELRKTRKHLLIKIIVLPRIS